VDLVPTLALELASAGCAVPTKREEKGGTDSKWQRRTGSELMGWSLPWQATMGPCGPPAASALHMESARTTNAGSGTIVVRFSCLRHKQPRLSRGAEGVMHEMSAQHVTAEAASDIGGQHH
jgi:hypothetical protein